MRFRQTFECSKHVSREACESLAVHLVTCGASENGGRGGVRGREDPRYHHDGGRGCGRDQLKQTHTN